MPLPVAVPLVFGSTSLAAAGSGTSTGIPFVVMECPKTLAGRVGTPLVAHFKLVLVFAIKDKDHTDCKGKCVEYMCTSEQVAESVNSHLLTEMLV